VTEAPLVVCPACNAEQGLENFRIFSTAPVRYYDFCSNCEQKHGVLTLYRTHYSLATPIVRDSVLGKTSIADVNIEKSAADRKTAAQKELARRELARRSLLYFTTQFHPTYKAGWVHNDIARRLERFLRQVEAGESPCLMIFVPPRHGKSTLASDMFPSWALGHHPEWEVISCSYTAALPIKFSRSIRDRMKTAEYAKMFPHAKIRSDSQNVESWDTTSGGSYTAAGVGGSITGKGAHILITDDPIKDYEEASSEKIRTAVFDWYNTTAKSRMAPGGGKLIIQTRWHDLDLAGAMLQGMEEAIKAEIPEGEYDNWEVVSYPAIAEHDEFLTRGGKILLGSAPPDARVLRRAGDALHPDRYTIKALKRQRNSMPAQQWNALYQQNPVPDDGDFFSKSDFRYFDKLADDIKHYRVLIAVDPSFGKDADNHWTVFVVGALDSNDDLYVIDMVRARMHSLEFADTLIALCNKYNPYQVGIERGAYEKAVRPIIDVKTSMNRIYIPFTDKLVPIQEKTVRAKPLQARLQMGKLHLLNQPWAVSAVQEMLRFPNGVYDDVVDAMAWLSRLALLVSPPRKYAKAKKKVKSWQDTLKAQGNGSNKSFMAA